MWGIDVEDDIDILPIRQPTNHPINHPISPIEANAAERLSELASVTYISISPHLSIPSTCPIYPLSECSASPLSRIIILISYAI